MNEGKSFNEFTLKSKAVCLQLFIDFKLYVWKLNYYEQLKAVYMCSVCTSIDLIRSDLIYIFWCVWWLIVGSISCIHNGGRPFLRFLSNEIKSVMFSRDRISCNDFKLWGPKCRPRAFIDRLLVSNSAYLLYSVTMLMRIWHLLRIYYK